VLVVLFYYVVSISLVLLNKMVLNSRSLPYPLFVSWTQLVVAVVCIWLLSLLKRWHVAPFPSSNSTLLLTTLLS
jgi:GDP-fucose transporter C1